ncbi:MAG: hypothetical protein HY088_01105 [Ignavibacteriales bacterium]|nr:hypothetical protein [Ignavibacteriales bacterium]
MRAFLVVVGLLVICESFAFAQCDGKPGPDGLTWNFDEKEKESFSLLRFIGSVFTPQLIQDTRQIRAYVRDERFGMLLKRCGDMRAIDAIYQKALKITDYSIGRALFLSMMATLEHRNLDLKAPLFGVIRLPLTFEEDSLFKARMANLPSKIYSDTPEGESGDKDKLQHFFASAYLAYASESPEFARASGNLVEWGEAKFIVGGADDPRDKRANQQGEHFGHDLLSVKNLLPSDYFSFLVDD